MVVVLLAAPAPAVLVVLVVVGVEPWWARAAARSRVRMRARTRRRSLLLESEESAGGGGVELLLPPPPLLPSPSRGLRVGRLEEEVAEVRRKLPAGERRRAAPVDELDGLPWAGWVASVLCVLVLELERGRVAS